MTIRRFMVLGVLWALYTIPLPAAVLTVTLERDTAVPLRLIKTLTSAAASPGERVEFEVTQDVRVGGFIVIPKGSRASGVVADVARRGRMGRPGKLEIDIRSVCAADGQAAAMHGVPHTRALDKGSVKTEDPSNNALMLPALPVLVFLQGKDIEIPAGREATAYVSEPLQIATSEISTGPNSACSTSGHARSSPAAALSVVQVRSSRAGQEIQVDGKYAGETPALLRLPAGTHAITVSNGAGESWQRSIFLTPGGETQVTAQFESRSTSDDIQVARAGER